MTNTNDVSTALLIDLCRQWADAAWATHLANREAAEAAVRRGYQAAGFDPPRVLWVGSPWGMHLTLCFLSRSKEWLHRATPTEAMTRIIEATADCPRLRPVAEAVLAGLRAFGLSARVNVGWKHWVPFPMNILRVLAEHSLRKAGLLAKHEPAHLETMERALGMAVRALNNRDGVIAHAALVRARWVRGLMWSQMLTDLRHFGKCWRGNLDPWQGDGLYAWLACCEFGIRRGFLPADLHPWLDLARECAWWWTGPGLVILAGRPSWIHLDEVGRLHHETREAICYPDSWGVYAWHGVVVPGEVIQAPTNLTPGRILQEPNVEVRRIMIERQGLEQFLAKAQPQCLDQDQEGRRQLYRLGLEDDEPIVTLKVRCPSTGRVHVLRVPPTVRTCRQAVAWTFGIEDPAGYQPAVET